MAFHAGPAGIQALALAGGVTGLAGSYLAARSFRYGGWVLRLVLAGIAVSALLSAGVGALKLAADPLGELPELTFWLLGGLWRASWRDVLAVLPAIAAGLGVTLALRGRLDLLSLDDRVAHSLGAAASRERLLLLLAATLATAAAVSVSGLVGWIGLMAPHAARRLFGASSRRALPAAVLLGAASVLACDTVARTLLSRRDPPRHRHRDRRRGRVPRPDDQRPAGARGMSAPLLEARGVSVAFPARGSVLGNLSFAACAGTVTAVLGPNGAGKTTLLDVCLGWRRPDRGTVLLDGRPLGSWGRARAGADDEPRAAARERAVRLLRDRLRAARPLAAPAHARCAGARRPRHRARGAADRGHRGASRAVPSPR